MNSIKFRFILLPSVIIVWGIIFYRVSSNFYFPRPIILATTSAIKEGELNFLITESFTIAAKCRDPFLDESFSESKAMTKIKPKHITTIPISQVIIWPNIKYEGRIKNMKSNAELILVIIDEESLIMKMGEKTKGIKLLKVYKDSIEIEMNKIIKIVKK